MFFSCEGISNLLTFVGLPTNELLVDTHPADTTALLSSIMNEKVQPKSFGEFRISLLLQNLILHLGREKLSAGEDIEQTPVRKEMRKTLEHLRQKIYMEPQNEWNIDQMACAIGVSAGWFTSLYKEFFGTTPKHDILLARIEKAKNLLLYDYSILDHIASACGFKNEYHFSSAFKKLVGVPPGIYRSREGSFKAP